MKNFRKKFFKTFFCLIFCVALIGCTQEPQIQKESSDAFIYSTYEKIIEDFTSITNKYPEISKIDNVGESAEGRTIKAFYLSSHPDELGKIPSVRLVGNIHGNEKISSEILLRFFDYATSNYDSNPRIKKIVDENCIVIIPIMNPDGYVKNMRQNSAGVDLNRDFINYLNVPKTPLFSQPETRVVSDYNADKFDCSISFHSGDIVISMLLDFAKSSLYVPEHLDLAKMLAQTYAEEVCTDTGKKFYDNPDIFLGSKGVIVGGDWYVVLGSLQDWSYLETGCIDMTVELSDDYAPNTKSKVNETFLYNRDGIIAFIEKAKEIKEANIDKGSCVIIH